MSSSLDKFKELWARISRLDRASAVLSWDMETYMPEEGVAPRAEQLALLSELGHRWLISEEMGNAIKEAETETQGMDYYSDDASMLRAARRDRDKKIKIPEDLVARLTRTTARANTVWVKARRVSNFADFAPMLSEIVDLNREQAECLGYREHIYDALLDLYEPDMTTSLVDALFAELKKDLVPFAQECAARAASEDARFLDQKFDIARQEKFGMRVLNDMRYNLKRGRQDQSAHPFTTSFSPYDVRITTRFAEDDLLSALFSTIHEAGHALYDQGLPLDLHDTPLCQPISLGVHESQSRLWENIVGRSRGFWNHYLPVLKEHFPGQLDDVGPVQFYRAVNLVRPGLIRVESDELTYNLHIFIRFEIEKDMIDGSLKVKDIPMEWNRKYREYLGITPPDDARGCLQDIHWAHGAIGYFPTYAIGNLLSAQLYERAVSDLPEIPRDIEQGNFSALLEWLRKNIHRHGSRYTFIELVRAITGVELQVRPFMAYLENKFKDLYG